MTPNRRKEVTSNLSKEVKINTIEELNARSAAADFAIWKANGHMTGYMGQVARDAKFRADHYAATGVYLRGARAV